MNKNLSKNDRDLNLKINSKKENSKSSLKAEISSLLDINLNENLGLKMHNLAKKLFPINRSITGQGFRTSLEMLNKELLKSGASLSIHSVKRAQKPLTGSCLMNTALKMPISSRLAERKFVILSKITCICGVIVWALMKK